MASLIQFHNVNVHSENEWQNDIVFPASTCAETVLEYLDEMRVRYPMNDWRIDTVPIDGEDECKLNPIHDSIVP